ncbi:hypothetical protein Slin14017_G128280 [Septoria linicola]|nr:hypothetical protein Slin14017_G128280 [Septoria linicola]
MTSDQFRVTLSSTSPFIWYGLSRPDDYIVSSSNAPPSTSITTLQSAITTPRPLTRAGALSRVIPESVSGFFGGVRNRQMTATAAGGAAAATDRSRIHLASDQKRRVFEVMIQSEHGKWWQQQQHGGESTSTNHPSTLLGSVQRRIGIGKGKEEDEVNRFLARLVMAAWPLLEVEQSSGGGNSSSSTGWRQSENRRLAMGMTQAVVLWLDTSKAQEEWFAFVDRHKISRSSAVTGSGAEQQPYSEGGKVASSSAQLQPEKPRSTIGYPTLPQQQVAAPSRSKTVYPSLLPPTSTEPAFATTIHQSTFTLPPIAGPVDQSLTPSVQAGPLSQPPSSPALNTKPTHHLKKPTLPSASRTPAEDAAPRFLSSKLPHATNAERRCSSTSSQPSPSGLAAIKARIAADKASQHSNIVARREKSHNAEGTPAGETRVEG